MSKLTKETCIAFYKEREQLLRDLAKKYNVAYEEMGDDYGAIFSLGTQDNDNGLAPYCIVHDNAEIMYISFKNKDWKQWVKEWIEIE